MSFEGYEFECSRLSDDLTFVDGESKAPEPSRDLIWIEPQPEICQLLAQAFIGVLVQIDNGDPAAWLEYAVRFRESGGRTGQMMQDHTENHRIDLRVGHRQLLQIAQSEVAAFPLPAQGVARQLEHGVRGVHRDDLPRSLDQCRQQ